MLARWSALLLLAACGGASAAPAMEPAPAAAPAPTPELAPAAAAVEHAAPDAAGALECAPAVSEAEAEASFQQAIALEVAIERGELDRKRSREQRFRLYDRAAAGFHRDAQERAGAMRFAGMYMGESPRAEQRAAYVEALARLIVAARRGNQRAARFMPGMDALISGEIPETLDPPLAELPRDWIALALETANRWVECVARSE
jgi:hypothetical protein